MYINFFNVLQSLEDLVIHYDGSVRNAEGDVVQINYGCDGLDPTYMEGRRSNLTITFFIYCYTFRKGFPS